MYIGVATYCQRTRSLPCQQAHRNMDRILQYSSKRIIFLPVSYVILNSIVHPIFIYSGGRDTENKNKHKRDTTDIDAIFVANHKSDFITAESINLRSNYNKRNPRMSVFHGLTCKRRCQGLRCRNLVWERLYSNLNSAFLPCRGFIYTFLITG